MFSGTPPPIPRKVHPNAVEIRFPAELEEILAKDMEIMNTSTKLVKLPAAVTIKTIIEDVSFSLTLKLKKCLNFSTLLLSNLRNRSPSVIHRMRMI